MDIAMPDLGGLETLPRIIKNFPSIKVVILSAYVTEEYVSRALRSGASGYMLKHAATVELELVIKSVAQGKIYLSPSISRTIIDSYLERVGGELSPLEQLTSRQREILQMIAEGKNTKEIASTLEISVKTVEAHRLQLMARLDIHDVPGLVRYAVRVTASSRRDAFAACLSPRRTGRQPRLARHGRRALLAGVAVRATSSSPAKGRRLRSFCLWRLGRQSGSDKGFVESSDMLCRDGWELPIGCHDNRIDRERAKKNGHQRCRKCPKNLCHFTRPKKTCSTF